MNVRLKNLRKMSDVDTDEYDVEPEPARQKFDIFRKMMEECTETRRKYLYVVLDPISPVSFSIHYKVNHNCSVKVILTPNGESIDIYPCQNPQVLNRNISTQESRLQAYECICKMMPKCLSILYSEMRKRGFVVNWPGNYMQTTLNQGIIIKLKENSTDQCFVIWSGPSFDKLHVSYVDASNTILDTRVFDSSASSAIILCIVRWLSQEQ